MIDEDADAPGPKHFLDAFLGQRSIVTPAQVMSSR
jgi:hypothetical protein